MTAGDWSSSCPGRSRGISQWLTIDDEPRGGEVMSFSRRPVRDREVVLAAALIVAVVLTLELVTGLVPALDDIIGLAPVVIVTLVVVTIVVLARALWAGRGGRQGDG
jgi:hypothetical protein